MNTTYDVIWDKFESIIDVDDYEIPSTVDGRKKLIENGCDIYNEKAYDDLEYDTTLESVNRKLDRNRISAIANAMILQICLNMLSSFTSTYSVFQSDIGIKDYKGQVSARQNLVDRQEKILNNLIFAICEDFGGDE